MKLKKKGLAASVAIGASVLLLATGCSAAGGDDDGVIKIGVLATSEGNLAFGMDEAKAAIGVAMEARGGTIDGGEIAEPTGNPFQAKVAFAHSTDSALISFQVSR